LSKSWTIINLLKAFRNPPKIIRRAFFSFAFPCKRAFNWKRYKRRNCFFFFA